MSKGTIEEMSDSKTKLVTSVESDSKMVKFYNVNSIIVFWNMIDYPILFEPENQLDLDNRFRQAMEKMGFHGNFQIRGFGADERNRDGQQLFDLYFLDQYEDDTTMADVVITAAFTSLGIPRNFVIVAKQPLESELHRVLHCVNSRGHTVLLVEPKEADGFYSTDSIFESTRLLGGGRAISKLDCYSDGEQEDDCDSDGEQEDDCAKSRISVLDCDSDGEQEDDCAKSPISKSSHDAVSKIEDFTAPVRTSKCPRNSVFWDLQDHPFPVGPSPDSIFEAIKSALVQAGWNLGLLSVWAYVDEKKEASSPWCKFLGDKKWESRLYFLPIAAGDKCARLERMFHDILLWEIDNPADYPFQSNVFVVSDNLLTNEEFRHRLKMDNSSLYGVIRVHCDDDSPNDPQWPLLSFLNGVYCNYNEEEDEESRKKKKSEDLS